MAGRLGFHSSQSLKHRQLSSFLLSFLLPSFILIVLLFSFFINQNFLFHAQEQKNTLEILSSHLTSAMNSDLSMSLTYIFDSRISNLYNFLNQNDSEANSVSFYQHVVPYSEAISQNMTLLNENILGIGFLPCGQNENRYFYTRKYCDMEIREITEYKNSAWHQLLQEKSTQVIFTSALPYQNEQDEHTLSIIRAAKNIDKNKVIGYIIVDVSMDFLYDLLDELSISPHSGILLSSPAGELLFSTNESLSASYSLIQTHKERLTLPTGSYDVQSYTDREHGFTFYYLSSRMDLYVSYLGAFLLILAFYIGMILLAFFMFRYNSLKITRSVTPILEAMDSYKGGLLTPASNTQCCISEFRLIMDGLNDMVGRIDHHIKYEYQLKMEQQIAEYQALQAEVDPHFLYNTLNIFITLNRLGEKSSLENAIVSLSHLFRYTCEHTTDSTIDKEFSFIKDYLYLQQIRFDDRLTFHIYIEPGLENFRIPKLLVQPLIENAIVHSLEPSGQTVDIQISAFTAQTKNALPMMVLAVVNTGLPFVAKNVTRKRVGLKNIENRLSIFNPNSFFIIGGGIDKPTKCYIIIPMESTEE